MSYINLDTAKIAVNKNYVPAPRLQNGTTSGWSLFNTTLTGVIPTGSVSAGAASIGTFQTVTGANAIQGFVSLNTAANAWSTGQGFISDTFTIDVADQAKVMQGSFYYRVNSGASNAVFSGTSTNTFAIYIRDVTNSAWIQPAGVYSINQSSGVGFASFTFQTTSNSTQYQVAILAVNSVIGAVNLTWDDFYIGPQKVVYGAPITDWQSYTPTGNWTTNTTYAGRWRRVGDSMEVEGDVSLAGGAPGGTSAFTFGLPSGYTIDTTKLPQSSNQILGEFVAFDTGTANYVGQVIYSTTSVVTAATNSGGVSASSPFSFNTTDRATLRFTVPITGWSSTVQMSSDTDTRVVAFNGRKSGTQSLGPNNSSVAVSFVTTSDGLAAGFDTHGAWNGTDTWTCPVPGYYHISAILELNSTNVLNNDYYMLADINGTTYELDFIRTGATTIPLTFVGSNTFFLRAGQTVRLLLNGAGNNSVSTLTANTNTRMTIHRLSGPSAIAASETVAVRATTTDTTSWSSGSTNTIVWNAESYDTHGSFASNTFTAPIAGKYAVKICLQTANATFNTLTYIQVLMRKNSSTTTSLALWTWNGTATSASYAVPLVGSDTINLLAGETLDFRVVHNSASNKALNGIATDNYIVIERIGN